MLNVFVAETVQSENKGEAALMHGIMKTIVDNSDEDVLFYLCSETQALDQQEYGDEVIVLDNQGLIPLEGSKFMKMGHFVKSGIAHLLFILAYYILGGLSLKLFKNRLWEAYYKADVLIVGHDNAFSKFHIPLMFYSLLLRKKTIVYGTTIMPKVLNTNLVRKIATIALNRMTLITTREPMTYEHLQRIGVNKAPLYCTADKAFILEPVPESETDILMQRLGLSDLPRPIIGVMAVKSSTVFKAAFKGNAFSPEEKYEKHAQEIADALDIVHAETGGTFVFVPHCIGPSEELDDRHTAVFVSERMKAKEHTFVCSDVLRVTELKAILGRFDMVVSERTHGGINAASMLVPTLWITHPGDHRTYGIVGESLSLPECLYNIEDLSSETLSKTILATWHGRQAIVAKLKDNIPKAQALTNTNGQYFKKHVLCR